MSKIPAALFHQTNNHHCECGAHQHPDREIWRSATRKVVPEER
jgi:hypothetical protein